MRYLNFRGREEQCRRAHARAVEELQRIQRRQKKQKEREKLQREDAGMITTVHFLLEAGSRAREVREEARRALDLALQKVAKPVGKNETAAFSA